MIRIVRRYLAGALAATLLAGGAAAGRAAEPALEPAPTIPPATLDDTLEVEGEALAARVLQSRMFLDVRINGQGPFRFLVDSGADRTVVAASVAARLGLPARGSGMVQGMAGSARAALAEIDTLRIGNSDIAGLVAPVLADGDLGADGIIGIDALADQRLMLDFANKRVTVQDSRQPTSAIEPGEIVVTARRRRGQLILTQVTIAGRPVYAVIDTGADISIGNDALRKLVFRNRRPPNTTVSLLSVTGQRLIADLVTVPELRIGGITARDIPVAFVEAPPFALFGLSRQPALLLGTDMLQAFRRLSLDFRRRKVRFALRR